uniref:glutaminase n=1 Tax=Hirondellea gigas TaxID=1518452 RepID=A0A6A7G3B3_9CRUS
MINAGAIMTCAMIGQGLPAAGRFQKFTDTFSRLCGVSKVGYSNEVFLTERAMADRNFCLGYMMRESKAFPFKKVDVSKVLELYFQTCAIELSCTEMSVLAATLANGGVCPLTNDAIFEAQNVRNCLALMLSCGLYDYSGEWAFSIGLPAKSGVCGGIFIVIPNKMGIALYSPRLDSMGNSARGVEFAKRLVKRFAFHHLDNLRGVAQGPKSEPCVNTVKSNPNSRKLHELNMTTLLNAASRGDLNEISRLIADGMDIYSCNYDKRTALHLAASENRKSIVKFLIHNHDGSLRSPQEISPLDRWAQTPLDDAHRGGWTHIIELLENAHALRADEVVYIPRQLSSSSEIKDNEGIESESEIDSE